MVENTEFVDFNHIKTLVEIDDESLFETYLRELYKDLVDRAESSKKQGIGKITFYDYMKLQVFIAEKLFNALDKDGDGFLSVKEFVEGLMSLFFGNFNETARVIFNIFDFDKDGKINKGDIKITMSYLPLKESSHKDQMESLNEIEEILNLYFKKNNSLDYLTFIDCVKNIKSDIYLQLLCFIYENKPFNKENVEAYKYFKKKSERSPSPKRSPKTTPNEKILLSSPSRKSKLLPASTFLGITLENFNYKNLDKHPKKNINKDEIDVEQMDDFVRLPNTNNKEGSSVLDSPTKFLKKLPSSNIGFSISLNDMNSNDKISNKNNTLSMYTGNSSGKITESPNKKKSTFSYSDYIYKITENNNLKKYYLSIVGKDIYYYKTEKKEELQGMHNLTGCFVKEKDDKVIEGNKLYGFSIIFSNKTRSYYTTSKKSLEGWTNALRQSIGYQHFTDFYEMKADLGEGKFGLVKLGIHKKTGEKVAIKIIKKDAMDNKDLELVRSEIDIMKLCRHDNVVRLLDHFENSEYIFIVMEYLAGGDLSDFFKRKNYTFSEKDAASIISQICKGIEYLHKYGVVHRDLKPENIMMAKKDTLYPIKIMDFGLSKIMGPLEKAADGFGTLSFVAPEVLIRKPYNKEVDIWSIGVTLYYMLTGTLPFDDDDDNEELIAKKIVFSKLQFYDKKWKKVSDLCHDFIEKCLVKEPEKRVTTTELLAHPWIEKFCEGKFS